MSIRTKLFLVVLAVVLPALALVGTASYLGGRRALRESTFDRLTSVRSDKAGRLRELFRQIRSQARVLAESPSVLGDFSRLEAAFSELENAHVPVAGQKAVRAYYEDHYLPLLSERAHIDLSVGEVLPHRPSTLYVQYWYVVANGKRHGQKKRVDDPGDGSRYTAIHRELNPTLRKFAEQFGLYDIFLIAPDGTILYTVAKELDIGRNLTTGPLARSNLARAFREALASGPDDLPVLVDFARYVPSLGQPASFVATPIVLDGRTVGVVAVQVSIEGLDHVMTSGRRWRIEGLGSTGETYLVGPDHRMRSNSRFLLENPEGYFEAARKAGVPAEVLRQVRTFGTTILLQEVRSPAVDEALSGRSGAMATRNYRGTRVLSAFAPANVPGVHWAVISEIEAAEAYAPIRKVAKRLAIQIGLLLFALLGLSWVVANRFVAPVLELEAAAQRFAEGGEDATVTVRSKDELGALARTFNRMVEAIRTNAAELRRKAEELENVASVILRWDSEGRITFINEFGLRLFGYEESELAGRPILGTIVPDTPEAREGIARMLSEIAVNPERYENDETENTGKDGRRIWVAWRNTPILDEDGRLREILTVGIDITERRRIEREVAEQKQLLENTLESLTHPFYVVNAEDFTIAVANSAARRLGPAGARTCYELTHGRNEPCGGDDHRCPMLEVRRTGEPFVVEHIHGDGEGGIRYVEVHGYPIFDAEGRVVQMIEYSLDITERKLMQMELERARDAAEAANRAKSTFLANMSHELRTPMNAIIGYSEMLAEDAEDEGLEEMVPDLEKINRAGKHLLALINDILDLSKIEAGRMDLYFETFDLAMVLEDAAATVTPLVEANGNRFVLDVQEGLGTVRLDLTKLRQALFNLLSNAAKFTKDGTVTLSARRESRDGSEWIVLSVADTGIGIAHDKLEKVFDEFSQADDSTTRDYGGTGLGLAISRRFCRMMGGDITVASTPGEGSVFTIELPARPDPVEAVRRAAASEEPAPESSAPGKESVEPSGRTILVVDDDPDSRDLVRKTLEGEGFSVVAAGGGPEALEIARRVHPSLITLDVLMPGMDGWTVLQEIKADPELREIPVIMVSIAGDRNLGCALGAVECLTKPVDRERLRELARQLAGQAAGRLALVVDDDPGIRALFHRALEDDGWVVAEAPDGARALALVQEHRPDLVLLDLLMPLMDGFEFLARFREIPGCAAVPVIVVTSKDLDTTERQGLENAVARIIEKGALTRQDLLRQVHEVLDRGGVDSGNRPGEDTDG